MKILIISYHFYPDMAVGAKRMSELASFLAARNCNVTAITHETRGKSQIDNNLHEKVKNVNVIHVKEIPKMIPALLKIKAKLFATYKTNSDKHLLSENDCQGTQYRGEENKKGKNYLSDIKKLYFSMEWLFDDKKLWSLFVMFRLFGLRIVKSYDVVISSGPPMSPHLPAMIAKYIFRSKWVVDLRDPWVGNQSWPDHVKSKLRDTLEVYAESKCFENADLLVMASPGIKKLVNKKDSFRSKTRVVLNGFDNNQQKLVTSPTGKLSLLYTGNLYFNRNPFPILKAFSKLVNNPETNSDLVKCVFVGDCESWNGISLKEWINENGMAKHVEIHEKVIPTRLYSYINDANILINFAQGQPIQIPAKIYDYIASGREMLLLADEGSDSASIVNESNSGRIIYSSDVKQLEDVLFDLYKFYVLEQSNYFIKPEIIDSYSRERQNLNYYNLLEQLSKFR